MEKIGDDSPLTIKRRLGSSPKERGSVSDANCPGVFIIDADRIAFVGTDVTGTLAQYLPEGQGVAPYECMVVLPARLVIEAFRQVAEEPGSSSPADLFPNIEALTIPPVLASNVKFCGEG